MNKISLNTIVFLLLLLNYSCSTGQTDQNKSQIVGGPCQDCEALLDYKLLHQTLTSSDTLKGFYEVEPKVKISGTVYHIDGKNPAKNVILYVYHTNREGIYEPSKSPIGWESRHGQFRGWMKTGEDGKFTFYSFKPAPYSNQQEPAHIHIYIKEEDKNPYYIDSYMFEGDPILTKDKKQSLHRRGGSGIIKLVKIDELLTANRDIILGLNIPDYR